VDEAAPDTFQPNSNSQLALINTILGLQRTLMAAERTAVTLIAFGFTLAQLFESMKGDVPPNLLILGPHVPRDVGLLMIAAGVGSLALFTWEYLKSVAYLTGEFAPIIARARMPQHQLICATAYAIIGIGVLAFVSVFVTF
jgi:putative membrane protein